MFIRKIKISQIKAITKPIELDFTPTADETYPENIETFGLTRNKKDFSALKQIGFIGSNASGKTSVLIGIFHALGIVANPQFIQTLNVNKNIFSEDPFEFSFEIVEKPKNGKNLVEKYIMEYTFNNGVFTKEKLCIQSATKTTKTEIKEIYRFENEQVFIGGKLSKLNHNPINSIFYLIVTGSAHKDLLNAFGDSKMYTQINIYGESLFETQIQLLRNGAITIPVKEEDRLLLVKLLQLFDNKITNITRNVMGNIEIHNEFDGNKYKYNLMDAPAYMSTGTIKALVNFKTLMAAKMKNDIILFDELGKSIHTGLFTAYLEIFKHSRGQFIFTTHNESLFKQSLRSDQIFNVSSRKGSIKISRISSANIDKRYITMKKVNIEMRNKPSLDKLIDIFDQLESRE